MSKGGLGALVFFVMVAHEVAAAEKSGAFDRISCAVVRFYVAKCSAGADEAWVRGRGATDAEVESARRWLTSKPVHRQRPQITSGTIRALLRLH